MKKSLLIIYIVTIGLVYGADHSLYKHSLEMVGGYGFNSVDTNLNDDWNWGFRYQYNIENDGGFAIDSYQFAFDHTPSTLYNFNGLETSITRFGGNLMWYMDNESDFTLFGLVGAGVQFFSTEAGGNEDGLFGTLGGGGEYQLRGDLAIVAEGKWLYAGGSDSHLLTNIGIKYSFGN